MLSVVIITFNEEHRIKRCIQSVSAIADEVVVVDSLSTDQTAEIARQMGARVVLEPFRGYVAQKNFALEQAGFDWILSLDADEAIDETLKDEIKQLKKHGFSKSVYEANRLNNYCGTWIRHGAWYPDRKIRLFFKNSGRWEGLDPHDRFRPLADIPIIRLKGQILHWSYESKSQHLSKIEKFARIAAHAYFQNGKRSGLLQIWFSPVVRFIRDYILKRGFLDGWAGLTIARITAKEVRLKYKLLWQLQKNRPIYEA